MMRERKPPVAACAGTTGHLEALFFRQAQ